MIDNNQPHVARRGLLTAFKRMTHRLDHVAVMQSELAEAQVALLEAQTGQEYARAMVKYNTDRVARLSAALEAEMARAAQAVRDNGGGP